MQNIRFFASDNCSTVHPKILESLTEANNSHQIGYGDDIFTIRAEELFKKNFGNKAYMFPVFTGTGSNVSGILSIINSFEAVLCTDISHINVHETGALEKVTGAKILFVENVCGKLQIEKLDKYLDNIGDEHTSQPSVISISQTTELGTVYSVKELKTIADYAHYNKMLLHVDGARIANACASLEIDFKTLVDNVDIDVLSFGATKNGLMFGEAVVFFQRDYQDSSLNDRITKAIKNFKYIRKQSLQLGSKMRYLSAQFIPYLENNLWLENAKKANLMAKKLYEDLTNLDKKFELYQDVESNQVFVKIPYTISDKLNEKFPFYMWDKDLSVARFVCSWDTEKEDIENFLKYLSSLLN